MEHDMIAALATPYGTSALGVIRVAGPGSVDAVAELCDKARTVRDTPGGRMRRVLLIHPETGEVLDEVVLGVFRAPRSYTGDDGVEIYCHGSPAGIRRILDVLYGRGFRPAEAGEFTLRAFLAGKIDLTRAEAIHEIIQAQTSRGHEMALRRLAGSVETAVETVKRELVRIMASVAVQLDYPEEETGEIPIPTERIVEVRTRIEVLSETYRSGRLYQEGVRVAIAGVTNAGKSSLFNALLKEDRSIVSATHGTTRDYIEGAIDVEGIPVHLFDTAGLRRTDEAIEGEGIRRTRDLLHGADLVLYVIDGLLGLTAEDKVHLDAVDGPVIKIWNKIDEERCRLAPDDCVAVSARTIGGIDELARRIAETIVPEQPRRDGGPVIDSLRQKNLLERASAALEEVERGLADGYPVDAISVDLQEAIRALGEITGEVTSEDILDEVFGGFCVGK
ncbi:MAG: tRNA uridine-5-carboxymethylaminomethyl(34) synthesis GTPase MnmE [Spirochaetales bacterium]|nr:tRNA uridine-5-carboxymethylaminomethyl(34) synthesis GTPase MnmE [Spirochaetales bacterium]